MTTHCWGELAAGEWTLRIQDTPSPGRDVSQQGLLLPLSHLTVNQTQLSPPGAHLFPLSLSLLGFFFLISSSLPSRPILGQLKRWFLLIYGTAEPPYAAHRQRARSAEMTLDNGDLTEEDSGESFPSHPHHPHQAHHPSPRPSQCSQTCSDADFTADTSSVLLNAKSSVAV